MARHAPPRRRVRTRGGDDGGPLPRLVVELRVRDGVAQGARRRAEPRTAGSRVFRRAAPRQWQTLARRRATWTLLHEISHMFGLTHCTYWRCVVAGSNSQEEADRSPLHACPVCLRKLYSAIVRSCRARGCACLCVRRTRHRRRNGVVNRARRVDRQRSSHRSMSVLQANDRNPEAFTAHRATRPHVTDDDGLHGIDSVSRTRASGPCR